MTRELLILRHGKSDWDADADDFHRPLKERGRRGAQRVGLWLLRQDLRPDAILSSPAERAIATAYESCKTMEVPTKVIRTDDRIYEAGLGDLLAVLSGSLGDVRRLLLVGHNPGLEDLVTYLTGGRISPSDDGKLLPTAALARLEMPDIWCDLVVGGAKLKSVIRPDALPEKFPYPSPDGSELRDRPAYYYTQSCVIPYRLRDGVPEILVISSRQKQHWVVPKGIKEPDLSLRESAAQEAWEEAGIEGKVGKTALGSYVYEKWGATCTVSAYPMEVTRVAPEAEWHESFRSREWVTSEQAVQRLQQDKLIAMVQELVEQLLKN